MLSELGIPTQPLSVPMDARALDGRSIGRVTHSTVPMIFGHHSESIQLLLTSLWFWDFLGSRSTIPILTGPRVQSWVGARSVTHTLPKGGTAFP